MKNTYSFAIMYAFLHASIAIVYMAMDKNNHICAIVYAFLPAFVENLTNTFMLEVAKVT